MPSLTGYPLSLVDARTYPAGFEGAVFIWDIDKTYLETHFSSMKGLLRIPVEFAIDKRAIPGMPEILRGLRRGAGTAYACNPLYFVSASPPQLRGRIERKMLLDGVEHDGITFKDWVRTIVQLRPGRLHEQVGFKICALLSGRLSRPRSVEYLFGDDFERDAEAFALYARILTGELSAGEIETALKQAGVAGDDRHFVQALLDRLGNKRGRVGRAFILLGKGTPPVKIAALGPILVGVRGAYQLALALYELGLIEAACVGQVVQAVEPALPPPIRATQRQDALARGLVTAGKLQSLSR